MSITVTVENDTIKLPVHVPDGTRLEITLPGEDRAVRGETAADHRAWLERLREIRERNDTGIQGVPLQQILDEIREDRR